MSWGSSDTDSVDLYDCRMRPWYVEAAASPKDLIILVDNSGSMMGHSKIVARHVINTLLDTLSVNDYVNVFVFSNVTNEVVPCFNNLLVQVINFQNVHVFNLHVLTYSINYTYLFNLMTTKRRYYYGVTI